MVVGTPAISGRSKKRLLDLGGDSLKAMMVLTRLKRKFDIDINIQMVFNTATVMDLSITVESLLLESQGSAYRFSFRDSSA